MKFTDQEIIQALGRMMEREKIKPGEILLDEKWHECINKHVQDLPPLSELWVRLTVQYGGFPLVSDKIWLGKGRKRHRRILPRGTFKRRGFHRLMQEEIVGKVFDPGVEYELDKVREVLDQLAIENPGWGTLTIFSPYTKSLDRYCVEVVRPNIIKFSVVPIPSDSNSVRFSVSEIEDAIYHAVKEGDLELEVPGTEFEWRQRFKDLGDPKLRQAFSVLTNRMSFVYGFFRAGYSGTLVLREMTQVLPIEVAVDELLELRVLELGKVYQKKQIYKLMRETDPSRERYARLDFKIKHATSRLGIPLGRYRLVPQAGGMLLCLNDVRRSKTQW